MNAFCATTSARLSCLQEFGSGLKFADLPRALWRIASDPHCQGDETSFRLQNRPDKRGFVWTFLTGSLIAYVLSGDRSGQTPSRVLGGTTGSLVVDAYTGYNEVTDVDGRTLAGRWSHYPASTIIQQSLTNAGQFSAIRSGARKITEAK